MKTRRGASRSKYSCEQCVGASLEVRHLRYFTTVCAHGSFRQAAEALGVRVSAVSRGIRDLEDEIGASLLVRHNRGVHLTFAGERFVASARDILISISNATMDAAAIGRSETGLIRVGVFSSIATGFLSCLIQTYNAQQGRVRLEFFEATPEEHVAAVRHHKLDVAFIWGRGPWLGCESQHLWSERVFAALPLDHRLADRAELELDDLRGEIFILSQAVTGREIHAYLSRRLAEFGHQPKIQHQSVGRDNLMRIVALSRGLTITSEATTSTMFPGVIFRPIRGEDLPFSAVWSRHNDNPALRRLLSTARSMAGRT